MLLKKLTCRDREEKGSCFLGGVPANFPRTAADLWCSSSCRSEPASWRCPGTENSAAEALTHTSNKSKMYAVVVYIKSRVSCTNPNELLYVVLGECPFHVELVLWIQYCRFHLRISCTTWSSFSRLRAHYERCKRLRDGLALRAALERYLPDDVANHALCLRRHLHKTQTAVFHSTAGE